MDNDTQKLEIRQVKRVLALRNMETRERYELTGERIIIGRAEENQICLKDDVYVSSHHAEVVLDGDICWINDLDSRNGTIRNGEVLDKPVHLETGDVITIGRTHLLAES